MVVRCEGVTLKLLLLELKKDRYSNFPFAYENIFEQKKAV